MAQASASTPATNINAIMTMQDGDEITLHSNTYTLSVRPSGAVTLTAKSYPFNDIRNADTSAAINSRNDTVKMLLTGGFYIG